MSAAKSARISVGHNEDPLSAVQKFAKIYGLESDAVQVLLTVVQQAMQARNDAIARAQAEAEEAEQRLREEQARIAAEIEAQELAAAAALREQELLARRQAEAAGKKRRKHKKRMMQRVINDHGEEEDVYYEDHQEENVDDEDEYDDDDEKEDDHEGEDDDGPDHAQEIESMMVLTGYDNYGNPIYAPVDPHRYHVSEGARSRARSQARGVGGNNNTVGNVSNGHHPHHHHHPSYPSYNNGGASPHGSGGLMHPRTLSDELDMVHVEDDYSSYTGTSSDLSDDLVEDDDDEDEDDDDEDEDYDSEEEDEENEEGTGTGGGEKKARRMRRRSSSKRSSILSQFF